MKKYIFFQIVLFSILFISCKFEKDDEMKLMVDPSVPASAEKPDSLITLPSGQVVKKVGNDYLWLGDILLSESDLKSVSEKGYIETEEEKPYEKYLGNNPITHRSSREEAIENSNSDALMAASVGVHPSLQRTWLMVRYEYAPDLTPDRRQIAYKAILHWEKNTNVRFLNANNIKEKSHPRWGDYPCVIFTNSNKNNSYVGMSGGRQVINLRSYQHVSAAIHEIGHAIGLYHEHCANNRDRYININYSNIKPSARHNFDIPNRTTGIHPMSDGIDFNSIMLYGSYTSDTNIVYDTNKPMMTKKDGSTWNRSEVLSKFDKMWANKFYLPVIPRNDSYIELEKIVYKDDNTIMSERERLNLQGYLNNGRSTPPSPDNRLVNVHTP